MPPLSSLYIMICFCEHSLGCWVQYSHQSPWLRMIPLFGQIVVNVWQGRLNLAAGGNLFQVAPISCVSQTHCCTWSVEAPRFIYLYIHFFRVKIVHIFECIHIAILNNDTLHAFKSGQCWLVTGARKNCTGKNETNITLHSLAIEKLFSGPPKLNLFYIYIMWSSNYCSARRKGGKRL